MRNLRLAVDVPQFAVAKDASPRVYNLSRTASPGFRRTVTERCCTSRSPGEDDSAARRQFEKHGLRYVSLEVSPTTLTKDLLDQFDRLVTENANLPLFIYDKDGALAGGMWYLYFRTAEGTSDETARYGSGSTGLPARPEQ